jgi:hypothetical protein
MILFLFLPLELLLGPDHDLKHAPRYFISRPLSLIIFNYQKSILLFLFFLKRARPNSVDKAVGLGHFEFKLQKNPPLLRSYYGNKNFFFGEWRILRAPASKEPSRDHQGQVSIIATRQLLTAGNDPQGPQSMTRGGVGTAVP